MWAYVMDVFCATCAFPALGWNWQKNSPPVHIYCSDMWVDNFVPRVFDICDLSLASMYHNVFKAHAQVFSQSARDLITLHGIGMLENISPTSEFGEATRSIYCQGLS